MDNKFLKISIAALVVINVITLAVLGFTSFNKGCHRGHGGPPSMGAHCRPEEGHGYKECHKGHHPDGKFGGKHGHMRMAEKLQFDEAQKEQLKALREKQHDAMKANMNKLHELRQQEGKLLAEETLNQAAIDEVAEQMGQLHKSMNLQFVSHMMEIKKLCKPEQMKNFNQWMIDMNNHMGREKGPIPPPVE
jgi:Spy/CpxP family protein refolding chaperone